MDRLGKIEQRLLAENLRFEESKKNDAEMYACGYAHGVEDTLGAVAAAEQQAQPAPRTNLDRIRGMTPQELVALLDKFAGGCQTCPAHDFCRNDRSEICVESMMGWLESEC